MHDGEEVADCRVMQQRGRETRYQQRQSSEASDVSKKQLISPCASALPDAAKAAPLAMSALINNVICAFIPCLNGSNWVTAGSAVGYNSAQGVPIKKHVKTMS